jgi:hypothetical protein
MSMLGYNNRRDRGYISDKYAKNIVHGRFVVLDVGHAAVVRSLGFR